MKAALVLGIGVGIGIAAALFGLAPSPAPLRRALLALHRPARSQSAPISGVSPVLVRVASSFGAERVIGSRLRADLAITEHDEGWFLSSSLLVGLSGVALGPVVSLVALVAGVALPWGLPVALSLVAGPSASAAQILSLRAEAARRRQDFAFALSAFLDLVVVSLAAGRGTEGALAVAAQAGKGPAFDSLRQALDGARLRGIPPWDALDELGGRLGVSELSGLAASIRLAGASGAKVRTSLAARAKSLRERGLAESRAAAESETEKMSAAAVLLVLAFIVLIGYPAVVQITTQL
jgi:tight adherence protein C